MSNGPFETYVPPGVYTRTLAEANAANLVAGARIPIYLGVGQEELEQLDLELVRGSSSTLDQQIISEDVSQSFVVDETNPNNPVLGAANGALTKFRVRNYPIVDGQGYGRTSNNVRSVAVTVNGDPTAVGSVQGANGYVILQVPPQAGDDVRCTYYFHRSDTAFTDDVSDQVTPENAELTSPGVANFDIVTGSSDTFIIKVDGVEYTTVLAAGTYTATALKSAIDAAAITGLVVSVFIDNQGRSHVRFTAAGNLELGSGNANGALGFSDGTKSDRNTTFKVFQRPIVDGTDGGITTTDPSKVVVLVDSSQVIPASVDGTNGLVTLPSSPPVGSTVTIQYWANTWQDTFDYLPNTLVTEVLRAGFSPGRNDYINEQDFVISNPSSDVSIVHWGASYVVASATRTAGAAVFDDTQIIPTLVDDRLWLSECARVVDTTVLPAVTSMNEFVLPEVPTTGNGRDTPLGSATFNAVSNNRYALNTNRPDLIQAWAGRDVQDALSRNPLTVIEVDATTRQITVEETVPPDHLVFATFWFSRLRDDTYIFTCKTPGAVGIGQYEVFSVLDNTNLYQTRFGVKAGLPETVQWPRGVEQIPDAYHSGAGTPVSEVVTATFSAGSATNAVFTNEGAAPWSFFATTSNNWRTTINATPYVTNLNTAVRGYMVGSRIPIPAGTIAINASVNDTLELTIDGTNVTVPLTAGLRTPAQIVTDINTAIDATPPFAPGPNLLASTVTVAGEAVFVIRSFSTPAALPGGFDHASYVAIRQGNAESTLGFVTFARVDGTPTATNKPATLLSSLAGTYNITLGVNDTLEIRVDGVDYAITLPNGAAVATAAIVAVINVAVGSVVSGVGTLANLNKLRLFSTTFNETSNVTILGGNANDVLGFTQGDTASAVLVSVQEIVDELMATAGFTTDGIAYASDIDGHDYITIESITTGAAASSIVFATGAASAFNETTGTEIVPGTSGDNGEDARDIYAVTSSNPSGSAGAGVPGQTYEDAQTGLRFTVLASAVGSYSPGGSFTLVVSPTFAVHPSRPWLCIGGAEVVVSDTVNVGVNDTATLQTFDPGGLEPAIGDFYFISYKYRKQDFSTRLFQKVKTIEANFGQISAENRVSLAAYLAIQNGASLVGIKQVLKVVNTNQANDTSFIEAIRELTTPLPGNIKPDVMVPLATTTAVYQFLMQHVETQSNIRNQGERMGYIGFASGTSPASAQTIAKSLASSRIIAVYPDSAVVTLTNELGEDYEVLVDGTFLAAAVAGSAVSPAYDVATPYTRRKIFGFTRLPRVLDPIEMNQTAVAGITVLEDLDPVIRIRQGLTTNMSNILTQLPTVTQIADFVHQQSRAALDEYVGKKFLSSRARDIEITMTSLFKRLVLAEIVGGFTGISANVDPDLATAIRFEAYYQPIFPLLYLILQYNLRASI